MSGLRDRFRVSRRAVYVSFITSITAGFLLNLWNSVEIPFFEKDLVVAIFLAFVFGLFSLFLRW